MWHSEQQGPHARFMQITGIKMHAYIFEKCNE